jgi:hypothetical protein
VIVALVLVGAVVAVVLFRVVAGCAVVSDGVLEVLAACVVVACGVTPAIPCVVELLLPPPQAASATEHAKVVITAGSRIAVI